MKKGRKKIPANIQFEKSQEDDLLMKSLLASIPEFPGVKEDDKESVDIPQTPKRKSRRAKLSDSSQAPDAVLDLHGKTREEAIMMVQNFVMLGHHQQLRTLLIITGKGRRSGSDGPILRQSVQAWLKRNGSPYIRDYAAAPAHHGGSGAIWVNLL
ncbi:MAG: Smr/MutS family protein [SAR324 cluster bacterium]|nr:Smr/MutS family protein [SAR324 cluster bacterium]